MGSPAADMLEVSLHGVDSPETLALQHAINAVVCSCSPNVLTTVLLIGNRSEPLCQGLSGSGYEVLCMWKAGPHQQRLPGP